MVCSIQCRCVPVALLMINCSCTVVRYKHGSDTAKELIHVVMGFNPVIGTFIHKRFHKSILAVSKHTNKKPCFGDFTGIRVNDVSRITCPVHFDLFAGISGDMHSGSAFFFILLDVIAELGIHQRFLTAHAAFFTVFHP